MFAKSGSWGLRLKSSGGMGPATGKSACSRGIELAPADMSVGLRFGGISFGGDLIPVAHPSRGPSSSGNERNELRKLANCAHSKTPTGSPRVIDKLDRYRHFWIKQDNRSYFEADHVRIRIGEDWGAIETTSSRGHRGLAGDPNAPRAASAHRSSRLDRVR